MNTSIDVLGSRAKCGADTQIHVSRDRGKFSKDLLGHLRTVSDGLSECFFSDSNASLLLVLNVPLFSPVWGLAKWTSSLHSTFHNVHTAGNVHDFMTLWCIDFVNLCQQLFKQKDIQGYFFYSIPESACKCSNTASIMQLWCHAMIMFPNGLSHNKRSASNHLDIEMTDFFSIWRAIFSENTDRNY